MRARVVLILLLLLAAFRVAAQDNPYEIDNNCYTWYQEAELLVGKEGFKEASDQLLKTAQEVGDKKAETLYYTLVLKDRVNYPFTPENEQKALEAQKKLKQVALETGHDQYYYYSYLLLQNYYYNNGHEYRALAMTREMQAEALEAGNSYGLWLSDRNLASLYIAQNDYVSAKPHLLRAIQTWKETDDETLKRQSPTRLYCDLADTYPIGTDSVRINVAKALEEAKQHLDTLRCWYYQARLAALDGNQKKYRHLRDLCLSDPQIPQVNRKADTYFSLIDAVFDGSIVQQRDQIVNLTSIREKKVIANLCENQGLKDFAFDLEKDLVIRLEKAISRTNQSRVSELEITMGKAALSADLETKEHQISRISHLTLILLSLLMAALALFFWIHNRKLREANERVRMADNAKTRFVQNMSHEVRTPLNAIVGFSQLLSLPDGSLEPEEKEEFASHIVNNTKMLTMLLDDILNASAMDNGNYSINYEEGEKDYMAQAAISSSEHRLQPGVQLYYAPEEPGPFTFVTDPRRVQQILINLITNACKHTPGGEIKVSSSLSENPGYLTYAVTDTGPGVPPEQAEKIFERFTKLNEFVQGTGLGLSICRDIAGRMGAQVYLDTAWKGPGARFVFSIPLEAPKQQ